MFGRPRRHVGIKTNLYWYNHRTQHNISIFQTPSMFLCCPWQGGTLQSDDTSKHDINSIPSSYRKHLQEVSEDALRTSQAMMLLHNHPSLHQMGGDSPLIVILHLLLWRHMQQEASFRTAWSSTLCFCFLHAGAAVINNCAECSHQHQ